MKLQYIDIHSHIQGKEYEEDRSELLETMRKEEIGTIAVGVDKHTSNEALSLAEEQGHVYACIGIHPNDNLSETCDYQWFKEKSHHEKVVAIGECGLDYFRREKTNQEVARQEDRFQRQIELAVETGLPLMLHIRNAHEDALRILSSYKDTHGEALYGNVHFFTSTADIARAYIDLGFSVSFPGVITFSPEVARAVQDIPLEWMHAETDSPFAAPVPFRGKRNDPTHVREVVAKIAEVKHMNIDEVKKQLIENAIRTFKLPE